VWVLAPDKVGQWRSGYFLLTPSFVGSWDLFNPCLCLKGPFPHFHSFILPHPPGLKFWRRCLFAMFLLGIFIGVLLHIVGLRLFHYHCFWIVDLGWSTNCSTSWEGPLVFLLKAWSCLLEGIGFYTTGSPESVCETFLDINNHARDEPMHKKVMAKVLEDTNQGTHAQGDSCAFPFFGNIGAPLMATLNIPKLNVGLSA
jgi:hypothetical protein